MSKVISAWMVAVGVGMMTFGGSLMLMGDAPSFGARVALIIMFAGGGVTFFMCARAAHIQEAQRASHSDD